MKIRYTQLDQDNMRKYPVVLEGYDGLLVLFTQPKTGVVIKATHYWGLGAYSTTWAEDTFTGWSGIVTIEQ
jgi:hypothetical protein